LIFPKIAKL